LNGSGDLHDPRCLLSINDLDDHEVISLTGLESQADDPMPLAFGEWQSQGRFGRPCDFTLEALEVPRGYRGGFRHPGKILAAESFGCQNPKLLPASVCELYFTPLFLSVGCCFDGQLSTAVIVLYLKT
jgi:hypothetical protein